MMLMTNRRAYGRLLIVLLSRLIFAPIVTAQGGADATGNDADAFPPIVLTADVAVELAREGNIDIKKNQITLDALKRTKNTSWNSASPTLSLTGSMAFPNPNTTAHDNYTYSTSISGRVDIKLAASLYTSIKGTKLDYENGLITFSEAERTVELAVRKAFYGLLYEKQNIGLQERNTQTAKERYDQNVVKYRNGRIPQVDMLTSRVNYQKLLPTLEEARTTYQADMASFLQLIGLDTDIEIDVSGTLDDALTLGEITVTAAAEDTPSVIQAKNAVDKAQNTLLDGRLNAYGPTVSAGWGMGRSKQNTADDWTKTGELSVGVTIPLDGVLPWSVRAQTVAKNKDSVKTAQLNLDDVRTTTARSIDSAVNKARTGQMTLESLKANVELAQTTYDMTLDSYNHGFVDYLAVQSASDALLDAEVRLQQQEYNLLSTVLDLEGTLGVEFGTLGR